MKKSNECRIFLVDDDPFCRTMYKQHLINSGFPNVEEFDNGPDCLNSLERQPDVIFLDHGMGQLTGLEVLKKVKASHPGISVIFLSGEANLMTAVKALKAGATEYVVKGRNELENISKLLAKITASPEFKSAGQYKIINN